MTRLPLPLLAASALLIVACSAAGASGGEPASLNGKTYLSTAIEGADLVPDSQVRLSFTGGSLNANAGCNQLSGSYAIEGDRLRTGQMSTTEMGCDQALMRQDQWLAQFLSDVTFALAGDTLTLTSGDIRLTLTNKEIVTPDRSLEGRTWVLDGIVSGEAVSSVPVGVNASLRIEGGRAEINAGCNGGGGSVEVTPDTLTFGPVATTKMACDAAAMSVETAVLTVLDGSVSYSIDADVLTIDAGGAGLTFRAAP